MPVVSLSEPRRQVKPFKGAVSSPSQSDEPFQQIYKKQYDIQNKI